MKTQAKKIVMRPADGGLVVAPDWANFWGIDGDGSAYWYENRPDRVNDVYLRNGGYFEPDETPTRLRLVERPR